MNHLLEIDSVQLQFGARNVLSDIYLSCKTGEITGLLGKNGTGKSCLMKIIYGNLHCEKSVRVDHNTIFESFKQPGIIVYLPQFNFIPKSLSLRRVFQDYRLDYGKFQSDFSEFSTKEKITTGMLSGGERRLMELYIIVKSTSKFAMLDEPFTYLNPLQIEKVKELLIKEKAKKGLLITDHMYRHVVDISDSLYILSNGKTTPIKKIKDIETLGYARI